MTLKRRDEYETFTQALDKVLKVSHSEIKAKLDAEKRAKQQQRKRPSGHASREKG